MGKKRKVILFDLDGTLTDPKEGITKSFQYALDSFGIREENLDNLEKVIGPPLIDSFREFYHFSEEDAWRGTEKYRERFEVTGWKENKLYPGVPEMLKELKDRGIKLSIASSKPTVFVERICDYFDIYQYFDFIAASNLDGSRTGKYDIIEYAYEGLKVMDKNDMLMVGDRKFDIEGAKQFGIRSVGVEYGYGGFSELKTAGADFIVSSVEELNKLLKKL